MPQNFKIIALTIIVTLSSNFHELTGQTVTMISSGTNTSLRGLSVVNEGVIWVSGTNGTVGRSIDSGHTFNWITVKGFEKSDFRDIEAFDGSTAVIMSIASPAYILRTSDGGQNWKVVYENKVKEMFLDAMEFWDDRAGIVLGDPLDGKFFIATTSDGGLSWKEDTTESYPRADSGEACFASSGTNIRKLDHHKAVFVSGGMRSNLVMQNRKVRLPVVQGKGSTGANSVAVKNINAMIVAGGDFNAKDSTNSNCYITTDGGKSWIAPVTGPHGYRSCVEWTGKKNWVSCGLNGVDFSTDDGRHWSWISREGFHVCRAAKTGHSVFFAGSGGRIAKLTAW